MRKTRTPSPSIEEIVLSVISKCYDKPADMETEFGEIGLDYLDSSGLVLSIENAVGTVIPDEDWEIISADDSNVQAVANYIHFRRRLGVHDTKDMSKVPRRLVDRMAVRLDLVPIADNGTLFINYWDVLKYLANPKNQNHSEKVHDKEAEFSYNDVFGAEQTSN